MEKLKKTEKMRNGRAMILYLLVFLIAASAIALNQPLEDTPPTFVNAPDEHARYLVPQYIYNHGTLPTGYDEEVRIRGYGTSYALYNVLPYIFMGMAMKLTSLFTKEPLYLLYSARFVNVIFGLWMAYLVRRLSLRIFSEEGKKRHFDWLFCCLVVFLPQSIFLHTYVNTDSMALLSTVMILYSLVWIYQEGFSITNGALLCLGVIFCALSYYNAYGYILSALLLCLAYFFYKTDEGKTRYDFRAMLKVAIPITLVILVGAGWWFVRSYFLYDGDIFGFRTSRHLKELYAIESVNPLYTKTYQQLGYTPWQMMKERNFVDTAFSSFVATYGSMSIPTSVWVYRFYKLLFGVGLLGYVVTIPFYVKHREGKRMFFHGNMLLCLVLPIFLTIYYAFASDYQSQGRYMMPMLLPLMIYTVKGLERLSDWIKRCPKVLVKTAVAATIAVVMLMMLWMVFGTAMPLYRMYEVL